MDQTALRPFPMAINWAGHNHGPDLVMGALEGDAWNTLILLGSVSTERCE